MGKRQIIYRGSLKSCNYTCEYCPFSKHVSKREMEKDAKELERFVDFMVCDGESISAGAVQIVPYGEALIHEYYWKAMAAVSQISCIDVVGCQTNLSFPIKKMIDIYEAAGGIKEKLLLWCTYHPSMVSKEDFLKQCDLLESHKISFCVGAVGVPANIEILNQLRTELSHTIYMWINPMDGLGRSYTNEEIEAFKQIDAFFPYQLEHTKANPNKCKGCLNEAMFVHANGDVTPCNISRKKLGNIYLPEYKEMLVNVSGSEQADARIEKCGQKECSCFLAYSNRTDCHELACYGAYPTFRMAQIPQAMFLDVDGTLIKNDVMDDRTISQIEHWSKYTKIYLATSLPINHAIKKCSAVKQYLTGGVFANGGMISIFDANKTQIKDIRKSDVEFIEKCFKGNAIRFRTYEYSGITYKITVITKNATQVKKLVTDEIRQMLYEKGLLIIIENNYIEITRQDATKLSGVKAICDTYHYDKQKILVAGDSDNDNEILEYGGMVVDLRNVLGC